MKRSRTPLLATACALALLSLATVAQAQPGGPGGRGPGGPGGGPPGGFGGGPPGGFGGGFGGRGGFGGESPSHLLTLALDSAVWDEAKLTDDQLGKVTRLNASVRKAGRQARNTLRAQFQTPPGQGGGQTGDPNADRAARDAARQAEREARAENDATLKDQTDAALKKILNKPGQYQRLQQIDLQEAGPLVVARPDVSQALNIQPDQADQIQMVLNQMSQGRDQLNTQRREMFAQMGGGGRGGRGGNNNNQPQESAADMQARQEQMRTAMDKMRTDTQTLKDQAIAQIGRILTKAQKTKFASLQGKAFDVTQLNDGQGPNNPFNPGGGGRGPGGGPPGGGPGGTPPGTVASTTTAAQTKNSTPTKGATTKSATTKGTTTLRPATGR